MEKASVIRIGIPVTNWTNIDWKGQYNVNTVLKTFTINILGNLRVTYIFLAHIQLMHYKS